MPEFDPFWCIGCSAEKLQGNLAEVIREHLEPVALAPVDTEIGAIELAEGGRPAHLALEHRILNALE